MKLKNIILFSALLLTLPFVAHADNERPARAVFNVFTYRADGSLIGNTYGFFTQADGTGLTSYKLFVGAARAEVIDARGDKYEVSRILGASSTMDVLKLRIATQNTTEYLPLASNSAEIDAPLLLVNYSTKKKNAPTGIRVTGAAPFNGFKYYDITAANTDLNVGCPLINAQGEAVAIVQKNVGNDTKTACALDARVADSLKITTISALNTDLTRLDIPRTLPQNESDALAYIYMLGNASEVVQLAALNDFIAAYPDNADGYVNRANFYNQVGKYDDADTDIASAMEKALRPTSTTKQHEICHAYSKLIYARALTASGDSMNTLYQLALAEEQHAYELEPSPLYLQQQAEIMITMGRYDDAVEALRRFNATDFATPESFYRVAQVLEASKADSITLLAALDDVISHLEKPYETNANSPRYFFSRSMQRQRCGMYRESVMDMNEYEKIMGPQRLTHTFYFTREQAERKARMFQQALDDIRSAESRAEGNDYNYYRLEETSLLVQVQLYDEAITCGEDLLKSVANEGFLYRLLGIAYGEKGNKKKAVEYLQRAASLGEEGLETLLQKYK